MSVPSRTLYSTVKGFAKPRNEKLASTAQAHSSTNQRASSLWPTASKHYNIYIYIFIHKSPSFWPRNGKLATCRCRSPHSNSRCVESASEPTGCDAPGTNWHNSSKQVVRVTRALNTFEESFPSQPSRSVLQVPGQCA